MKKLMQLFRENARTERVPVVLNRVQANAATLYLYDVIDADWGIGAKEVAQAVAPLGADTTLHLRVNSPGGDVFEARAIRTVLDGLPGRVVCHVDALAASAATTVALAGDEIIMAPGAYWMIHNAWTLQMGDKRAMREMASLLEKMDGTIGADYAQRTGLPLDDIAALMDAETWMTAEEAKASGFASSIAGEDDDDGDESVAPQARAWNLAAYDRAPKALIRASAPAVMPDPAVLIENNRRRLRLLEIA